MQVGRRGRSDDLLQVLSSHPDAVIVASAVDITHTEGCAAGKDDKPYAPLGGVSANHLAVASLIPAVFGRASPLVGVRGLAAVVHAAGTLSDAAIPNQSLTSLRR